MSRQRHQLRQERGGRGRAFPSPKSSSRLTGRDRTLGSSRAGGVSLAPSLLLLGSALLSAQVASQVVGGQS